MTNTNDNSTHAAREAGLTRIRLEADLEDAVFKLLEAGTDHTAIRDVVSDAITEWLDENS